MAIPNRKICNSWQCKLLGYHAKTLVEMLVEMFETNLFGSECHCPILKVCCVLSITMNKRTAKLICLKYELFADNFLSTKYVIHSLCTKKN